MRYLNRIKPYLEAMGQFVGVMDTFSQVKADITSLIWGPIKLLLQISSTLVKSYDQILDLMGQIGDRLPRFLEYTQLFNSNTRIQNLLAIFFRDILDFHATALNFFKLKKWNLFFESLWPKYGNKIKVIMANIERHSSLMTSEISLADITNAHKWRQQALENYSREAEFQRRQDFEAMRQALSPKLYDDQLERQNQSRCPGTGEWLESNNQFTKWLDNKQKPQRLLWLQGIPGAGKTMVSSYIINKTRSLPNCNTIFAFLSYRSSQVTVIRTFHSFILQLLLDNPDLQPIISDEFQTNFRKLSSDTQHVRCLLIKLLQSTSITYMVVDGLDEIEYVERLSLLTSLLEINRQCEDMKLLISSRAEDDIARQLRDKCEAICVNLRNSQDIRAYLHHRSSLWLLSTGFDQEISNEVMKLLVPLTQKANGMILYIRLVLDGLYLTNNLRDIREDLQTLPEGLDEAYGRILRRIIEHLHKRECEQARRLFMWVGCSELSMRQSEIEAAFAIRRQDKGFSKASKMFLNIPRLCGPILEIDNDVVQFVHFTAKQYLFGPQSNNFVSRLDAYLDITRTCVRYLAFECFDERDSDDIEASIISGDYVLLNYAATQWLKQLQLCTERLENRGILKDICPEIEEMVSKRMNPEYTEGKSFRKGSALAFKSLEEDWPQLRQVLFLENSFWVYEVPFLSLRDDTTSHTQEMLSIFTTYKQFYRQFNLLLCEGARHREHCHCEELKKHYGKQLYKCDRLSCKSHRFGFENFRERNAHIAAHDRPFKCPSQGCEYLDIGFGSRDVLRKHVETYHKDQTLSGKKPSVSQNLEPDQLQALLADAIEASDLEYLRRFLSRASVQILKKLYWKALQTSTPAVVQLFVGKDMSIDKIYPVWPLDQSPVPLREAVRAGNIKVAKFFLEQGCNVDGENLSTITDAAIDLVREVAQPSGSQDTEICGEMFSLLIEYGVDIRKRIRRLYHLIPFNDGHAGLAIRCLDLLKFATKPGDDSTHALRHMPINSSSVEIADYLIRNGAEIDKGDAWHRTLLHIAVRRNTSDGANLARFLLESGADPSIKNRNGRTPGQLAGAKNISKWLGVTWDELVESTASARARRLPVRSVTPVSAESLEAE